MPGMPGDGQGQMPDLDQLPKELLPFLQPFLDQLNPQGNNGDQNNNDQRPERRQSGRIRLNPRCP